jgi:hypothetical protein
MTANCRLAFLAVWHANVSRSLRIMLCGDAPLLCIYAQVRKSMVGQGVDILLRKPPLRPALHNELEKRLIDNEYEVSDRHAYLVLF